MQVCQAPNPPKHSEKCQPYSSYDSRNDAIVRAGILQNVTFHCHATV